MEKIYRLMWFHLVYFLMPYQLLLGYVMPKFGSFVNYYHKYKYLQCSIAIIFCNFTFLSIIIICLHSYRLSSIPI